MRHHYKVVDMRQQGDEYRLLVQMACKMHGNLVQAWVSPPVADSAQTSGSVQAPEPPPAGPNREGCLWKRPLLKGALPPRAADWLLTCLTAAEMRAGAIAAAASGAGAGAGMLVHVLSNLASQTFASWQASFKGSMSSGWAGKSVPTQRASWHVSLASSSVSPFQEAGCVRGRPHLCLPQDVSTSLPSHTSLHRLILAQMMMMLMLMAGPEHSALLLCLLRMHLLALPLQAALLPPLLLLPVHLLPLLLLAVHLPAYQVLAVL